MKRFWDTAAPAPDAGGWTILLDGRPLRLPDGPKLHVAGRHLAAAVAAEWQTAGGGKGGAMTYADVPLTRLTGTAQERIAADPAAVALELARYGESDLLCYRADSPDALVQRQAAAWQPWLDWAATRYGARLRVATGVMHMPQDTAALAALAAAVSAYDPLALAALGVAIPSLGSAVLGLAMAEAALDAAQAHELAVLDELFQEQLWGADPAGQARRAHALADLSVAGNLLALLRADAAS